ncbi:hypothetical protein BKA64DRAFT_35982 [Cadophora sp. MPI-SDFR-AT-0126]|nr:hypothetical protein BKA64DRAFT_35982 [Leotiomycetes sp. MPI-SDFR-AT-0126]
MGHPVRSAKPKLQIGGLVVGWVTTSEYPLLYVFGFCQPNPCRQVEMLAKKSSLERKINCYQVMHAL